MMSRHLHTFPTQEALVETLSRSIADDLSKAIEEKGHASLIVSGGKTPRPLFERLWQMDIEWEKVAVGLCDERWLPSVHKESNEHFVKTYLLQGLAAKATFIGMYDETLDAQEAEEHCSAKIKKELFPFDVLILGMGSDAHTASLFPKNDALKKGLDLSNDSLCISAIPQSAPYARMSLTLGAILSAAHLYLHFEGEEKLAVYNEAIAGTDIYAMPIRAVLNQESRDVEVYCR
jgi:6-phosphogluconolactonase